MERVEVDRADQMHWSMRPNNPQLRYRELVIDGETVRFSGSKLACTQTVWRPRPTTWGHLFSKGFVRSRGPKPTPADFEISIAKTSAVTAYSLCPATDGPARAEVFAKDTWVAPQGPDALLMHHDTQVLLVLRRRPPGTKPQASFDCIKAATPTEKTICGSFDLAGWDRSVAAAWKAALDGRSAIAPRLRNEQKDWLRRRDACGTNAACIDERLWRRVDELVEVGQGGAEE